MRRRTKYGKLQMGFPVFSEGPGPAAALSPAPRCAVGAAIVINQAIGEQTSQRQTHSRRLPARPRPSRAETTIEPIASTTHSIFSFLFRSPASLAAHISSESPKVVERSAQLSRFY